MPGVSHQQGPSCPCLCLVCVFFERIFYFGLPWTKVCISHLRLALEDEGKEGTMWRERGRLWGDTEQVAGLASAGSLGGPVLHHGVLHIHAGLGHRRDGVSCASLLFIILDPGVLGNNVRNRPMALKVRELSHGPLAPMFIHSFIRSTSSEHACVGGCGGCSGYRTELRF